MPPELGGHTIQPHVSEPSAKGTRPAPTAAPEPLEEPPVQCFGFQGFFPGPCAEADANRYPAPPASSTITRMAPASASRAIAVASAVGTRSLKRGEPHVVATPFVSSRSFAAYGMPCSGWRGMPDFRSASARRAAARALSSIRVATALREGPILRRRETKRVVSSTDDVFPAANAPESSTTDANARSISFPFEESFVFIPARSFSFEEILPAIGALRAGRRSPGRSRMAVRRGARPRALSADRARRASRRAAARR